MLVQTSLVHMTPELAAEYLRKNTSNFRSMKSSVVKAFAEDMRAGKWEFNGEPIHVYEDGTLANGQHRLKAVVESGCTVDFLVVTGIPNDTKIFDFGFTRSVAAIAKAAGIPNGNAVSAIAGMMIAGSPTENRIKSKGIINQYVLDHNDDLQESYRICSLGSNSAKPAMKRSASMTVVYCLRRLNKISLADAEQFAEICNSGNIISGFFVDKSPSPALVLRRQIGDLLCGRTANGIIAEATYKALMDFSHGITRKKNYPTDSTQVQDLITEVNKLDGVKSLTEGRNG